MERKTTIKTRLSHFFKWCSENWNSICLVIIIFILLFITLILSSWLAGYWLNGIYSMHFELGSVWQGLGACAAAIGSLLTAAGISMGKYFIDSKYNSASGKRVGQNDGLGNRVE